MPETLALIAGMVLREILRRRDFCHLFPLMKHQLLNFEHTLEYVRGIIYRSLARYWVDSLKTGTTQRVKGGEQLDTPPAQPIFP